MALDLPERKCEWEPCGVIIKPKRRGQKYHSKKCRVAHYNEQKLATVCPHCRKPIQEP